MITAHAGSDGFVPNSISFISQMLNEHVDALEIDCNMTEDGIIYLNHNPVLDMRGLLSLDLALELIANHPNKETLINIDCKNIAIGRHALDRAQSYDLKERIILSGAINYGDFEVEERSQIFYNIENELGIGGEFDFDAFKNALHRWYEDGIRCIQSNYELVNIDIIKWVQAANLKLSVWTINDFATIDKFIHHGTYNVTSNQALAYRKQQ